MDRKRRIALAVATAAVAISAFATAARAQLLTADVVARQGIPAGNIFAPQTPSGMVVIGEDIWFGDEAQGLRHYLPVDPTNPTPLDTGQYQFDINTEWSLGGGACFPFCSVGQAAQLNNQTTFIAVWDHSHGGANAGLWMVTFQPSFGNFSPFEGITQVAPFAGLGGNLTTSVAMGPDGKLYFGNLKNGDLKRVTNPVNFNPTSQTQTVETVGGSVNGRPILSMAFNGGDLYIGTDQNIGVVRNAQACFNNSGGCGIEHVIADGFVGSSHPAVASDGFGKVYFGVNASGIVYRLTPADGRIVPIAGGFSFVAAHTNGLRVDPDGNLWIGDNPGPEGFTNSGRLSRIPAASLASVP